MQAKEQIMSGTSWKVNPAPTRQTLPSSMIMSKISMKKSITMTSRTVKK